MSSIATPASTVRMAADGSGAAKTPASLRLRIVIAGHQGLFREGLRALLEAEADCHVVGEANDAREALRLVQSLAPDVLVLDYGVPGLTALDVFGELPRQTGTTEVLLMTAEPVRSVSLKALEVGIRGLIAQASTAAQMLEAIRTVAGGNLWVSPQTFSTVTNSSEAADAPRAGAGAFNLTERELQVIAAVTDGHSNREISVRLTISEKTVKHHMTNIFDKLGVSSRLELALFAVHHRIGSADSLH